MLNPSRDDGLSGEESSGPLDPEEEEREDSNDSAQDGPEDDAPEYAEVVEDEAGLEGGAEIEAAPVSDEAREPIGAPEPEAAGSLAEPLPHGTQDEASPEVLVRPAAEAGPASPAAQRRPPRPERAERPERRLPVENMLRKGQDILVQVAKEGLGQKGPALTNYLSIPGRFLVLMPAVTRLGVSKRIDDEQTRRRLKEILNELDVPEGMGIIVRTAGLGHGREELKRDFEYLMNTWKTLVKKARVCKTPDLIYEEGDVITRVFRDVYTDDVAEILVDDSVAFERARQFMREFAPEAESKVKLYTEPTPLFHRYGIEPQIQRLFNRKVPLESGGSIVIEQTEALTAIDVNTGRFREKRNQEETILAINLEAAREIARQLRLRDLGGLVMIDLIDMDNHEHRRRVEQEFKRHLARDRARINVLPISPLGVVEMTRQRVRHSLRKALFERCPHCLGLGYQKVPETLGLELLRELRHQCVDPKVGRVRVSLNPGAAAVILNALRRELTRFEDERGVKIEIHGDHELPYSQWRISVARGDGIWIQKKISEVDDYVRNN
ncbi:MAG: Rne/Rng family ribonuclease [Planctomycetota bacterium]|nr:Rne/Rng family ribonuclease [Planctomycetota bacterium]